MSTGGELANNRIRAIDVIIFGEKDVGKRTFMECFTQKDSSTQSKMSRTVQKEYLKKTVWMPMADRQKAVMKFWKQAP